MTMPRIYGPQPFNDNDVHTVEIYQGAKVTIIVPAGSVVSYSFVDSLNATALDSDSTVATAAVVTTFDVAWPFLAFQRTSGAGAYRIAVT